MQECMQGFRQRILHLGRREGRMLVQHGHKGKEEPQGRLFREDSDGGQVPLRDTM